MTTNSSGSSGMNTDKNVYLPAGKWFGLLIILLVVWTGIYLFTHSQARWKGYEYTRFTKNEIRQINNILVTGGPKKSRSFSKPLNKLVPNQNDGFLDGMPIDTTAESNSYNTEFSNFGAMNTDCDLLCRTEKVISFISSQYPNQIDDEELNKIGRYIQSFTSQETGIFLADHKLKVRSYFWLTGAKVYGEVVFWVIFGVLCSLLFTASVAGRRNKEGFTQREVIFQLAKLFYAPLAALVLILAYSYFSNSTTSNIDASEGFIVVSFLIGVYSGSFMGLLDNFRRSIFADTKDDEPEHAPAPVYAPIPMTYPEYLNRQLQDAGIAPKEAAVPEEQEPEATEETIEETEEQPKADAQEDEEYPLEENTEKKNGDPEIEEVDIDLKLDLSGLFEEEKAELQRLGFSRAIVTLHNVNGKDIIPAKKLSEDTTTFAAYGVKPGIYIARATLSQRLRDDHIINLFGEKTAYVTEDKPGLELYVKKYEAID